MIELAKKHLNGCISKYNYGKHWQPLLDRMRSDIETFTNETEVLHYAQSPKARFECRTDAKESNLGIYERIIGWEFPWYINLLSKLSDDKDSVLSTSATVGGRVVSNVFYWRVRSVLLLWTQVPQVETVMEVGGGYGGTARLWLNSGPCRRYVLVDAPESLFFAEVCLRREFGNSVGYFEDDDPRTRILLVPIERLHKYKSRSDLVINIGSLQEMTDEWVDFYMNWLDEYDCEYFYSLNYGGHCMAQKSERCSLWACRPSANWNTMVLTPTVPISVIQNTWRPFVEGLYKKEPAQGSLDDWSVWRGRKLDRNTYFEGLDLLRKKLNPEFAGRFLMHVCDRIMESSEMLWVAKYAAKHGHKEAQHIVKTLESLPEKLEAMMAAS